MEAPWPTVGRVRERVAGVGGELDRGRRAPGRSRLPRALPDAAWFRPDALYRPTDPAQRPAGRIGPRSAGFHRCAAPRPAGAGRPRLGRTGCGECLRDAPSRRRTAGNARSEEGGVGIEWVSTW